MYRHTRLCVIKLRNLKTSLLPKNKKMQAKKRKTSQSLKTMLIPMCEWIQIYKCKYMRIYIFYYKNRLFYVQICICSVSYLINFFCHILEYFIIIIMFIKWCTVINPVSVHFGCSLLCYYK